MDHPVRRWESLADRQIRKAMEEGEFDDLPGEGKPFVWDDDENTPEDLRMAYKIMRENDLAPAWIMQGRELVEKHEKLIQAARKAVRVYKDALTDPVGYVQAEARYQKALALLREQAAKLNREIISYNLKLPRGVAHRPTVNIEHEVNRLMLG
ncbi:MAG: DUF1992 domain-containing protein [Anaerolineae bacterium]|nr:DUF1992 domain-containing protein [Anaerolineae bacterium]